MKKNIIILFLGVSILLNSGCATVFGGRISDCQRHAPIKGEHKRSLRAVPLIVNIMMMPVGLIGLAIDFSNGAIYQPCQDK